MSEYIFKLPDLGEGTVEAEIAEWMVKVGDVVAEEDPICAMLTDKAAVELTAPVSGRVVSVAGEEGDTVAVGTPLIVFETEGAASTSEADETAAPDTSNARQHTTATARRISRRPGAGKVLTSPSIRARAREAGIDLAQVTGSGPRGRILKTDFEAYASSGGAAPLPATAPVAATQTGRQHRDQGHRPAPQDRRTHGGFGPRDTSFQLRRRSRCHRAGVTARTSQFDGWRTVSPR